MPCSLVLEPGQRAALKLHAVNPDLMHAQKYPLEAAVHFLVSELGSRGTGALRGAPLLLAGPGGQAVLETVVCVEVR